MKQFRREMFFYSKRKICTILHNDCDFKLNETTSNCDIVR